METEYGYKRIWKIFLIFLSLVLFPSSLWSIYYWYYSNDLYQIFIVSIPLLIISIFMFIIPLITRIRLGNDYIEKIGVGSVKIFYRDVKLIDLFDNHIVLRSKKSKISITQELEKQGEILLEVMEKTKNMPNIEIKGSNKNKIKYMNKSK